MNSYPLTLPVPGVDCGEAIDVADLLAIAPGEKLPDWVAEMIDDGRLIAFEAHVLLKHADGSGYTTLRPGQWLVQLDSRDGEMVFCL